MNHSESGDIFGGNRWLYIGFSLVWMLLVLVSYWAFHPYYSLSISESVNYDILLVLLLVSGGAGYWLHRIKGRYNGLMIYGLILLLQGITVAMYGSDQSLFKGSALGGGLYFMGFNLVLHLALFLIILVAYTAGQLLLRPLSTWYAKGSRELLSVAVGASVVGVVMLLLGLAGLLFGWLLAALFLGLFAWQWKPALQFLQSLLVKRSKAKSENPWWNLPVLLLLISVAVNGIYALKALPIGFDGAGLYMNTTHLISEYNALPEGGQAFNWQVFLSLGELLYGDMMLSIMLSHFSGRQLAWLAAALFYLSPAANFHLTLDEKVDLGFLFITLSTLLLLLEYRVRLGGKKERPEGVEVASLFGKALTEKTYIWLLAGWLAGYAFGIKYTGIMSIFGFVVYLVYQRAGTRAGMGTLALMVSLLFLTGVYRFGYIELGNTLPIAVAGVSLAVALPLLFFGLRGKQTALKSIGQSIAVFALGGFLVFLPWVGKHLAENRSLGVTALVEGKSPAPDVRINIPAKQNVNAYQRIVELLDKRGVTLSAEQSRQVRAILKEYEPQIQAFQRGEISPEQRERYLKEVRRRFEREVLTAAQIAKIGLSAVTGGGPGVGSSSVLESGKREEVKRYMGYETGLPLFLSLPYDVSMNTNVRFLKYLDYGFVLFLFFPLLLFNWRGGASIGKNIALLLLLLLFWGVSVYSIYANGTAPPTEVELRNAVETLANKHQPPFDGLVNGLFMSIQQAFIGLMKPLQELYAAMAGLSFFWVFLVLIALAAAGYGLMRERLSALSPNFKAMLAFAFAFGFFWLLLGSGIVWYAFPMFAILGVVVAYYLHRPERLAPAAEGFARYWLLAGVGGSLFLSTALNFLSTTESEEQAEMRFQNAFVKYGAGVITKNEAWFEFSPVITELRKIINRDEDTRVYRVGTHYNYHIAKNDRRVYEDNQLGLFEDFLNQSRNPREFLAFLKQNGFDYVLFDMNTAGMDNTPEQSLAKKANQ
ncbi:MAG: hypothetical protein GVY26_11355, partial [Bacteroidetes bacterium]|nr:hypothetical protein [Bacteroidota bacterium]